MKPLCWDYDRIRGLLRNQKLPAMVVDLDCLDWNISQVIGTASHKGKRIRIATKSIRVPDLIRYIRDKDPDIFKGLMCYSVDEAEFLAGQSFDDLLVAYPTCDTADIRKFFKLVQSGHHITLMVDSTQHVQMIESVWEEHAQENTIKAGVCIDVDMSWRILGQHLGVFRSSILSTGNFEALLQKIRQSKYLRFRGVMGYEAQIAGMGEQNPFTLGLNPVKAFIKHMSTRDVRRKREAIHHILEQEGITPELYNGGGSGSLLSTSQEPWITEVAVGSGFLQSHLFDYYKGNRNIPAFCFALPVCRIPRHGYFTCKSGGFIASGEAGRDRFPLPFLPAGMRMIGTEGFGEVQTPVRYGGKETVGPGDPLFFRPAKAGEIAEHFREYILIRGHEIVDRAPTYRGLNRCFY